MKFSMTLGDAVINIILAIGSILFVSVYAKYSQVLRDWISGISKKSAITKANKLEGILKKYDLEFTD